MIKSEKKVSVGIPAFNEGKFIAKVVREAKAIDFVEEVIVVDGGSTDNTVKNAESADAKVLHQSWVKYPGKGIAMRDVIKYAMGDIIVFADADIINIERKVIRKLADPILKGEADFVKGTYERRAGRVTELVAKPLLRMFFPEYAHFSQPLSGELAGTREVFRSITLEEDWGVEIGMLIDVAEKGFRIKEVDLGFKEHDMKPLVELNDMAYQVARAVIKRAIEKGRLETVVEEELVLG